MLIHITNRPIPMCAVSSFPCKRYHIWSGHNTEAFQNPEYHFYVVGNAKYTLSEANTCVVYCECRLVYKTYKQHYSDVSAN